MVEKSLERLLDKAKKHIMLLSCHARDVLLVTLTGMGCSAQSWDLDGAPRNRHILLSRRETHGEECEGVRAALPGLLGLQSSRGDCLF